LKKSNSQSNVSKNLIEEDLNDDDNRCKGCMDGKNNVVDLNQILFAVIFLLIFVLNGRTEKEGQIKGLLRIRIKSQRGILNTKRIQ
jgi:hypothetical protein